MKFKITTSPTPGQLDQVYALRFQVFTREMERSDQFTDHTNKRIKDDLDDYANHFVGLNAEGRVIGALRCVWRKNGPFEKENDLEIVKFLDRGHRHLTFTSRLVLAPEYRQSFLLRKILGRIFKFGLDNQIHYDFIYCQPGLVALYERLGYRRYTSNFRHPHFGYETPMILLTHDLNHLRGVKSPFMKIVKKEPEIEKIDYFWFFDKFPEFIEVGSALQLRESKFWEKAGEFLFHSHRTRLLKNFSPTEITSLLEQGHVIKSNAGDTIIEEGEKGLDIYFIVKGKLEVRLSTGKTVALMNQGDFFGELAYFTRQKRTANVIALADCTLVVLTDSYLNSLSATHPALAVKLYHNFCACLADNLIHTNMQLDMAFPAKK